MRKKARAGLKPWKKGQSGNPNGRPKQGSKKLAEQHFNEAISILVELMHNSENERVRVACAEAILRRALATANLADDQTETIDEKIAAVLKDRISDEQLERMRQVGILRQSPAAKTPPTRSEEK